jgi:putative transposase
MKDLYSFLGISKQSFHQKIQRMNVEDRLISDLFLEIDKNRLKHKRMGAKSMYSLIKPDFVGVNKFQNIWAERGYNQVRRKKKWKTTDSNHSYLVNTNLTNGLEISNINQLWAADITYYYALDDVYYIFLLMDVYSRRILGYEVSKNIKSVNAIKVLNEAFALRNTAKISGLIHHSDRGRQYCCHEYIKILENAGAKPSNSRKSIENPYIERVNGIIKNDYLDLVHVSGIKDVKKEVKNTVQIYNEERPHSKLNNIAPLKFEKEILKMKPEERVKLDLYDFSLKNHWVF